MLGLLFVFGQNLKRYKNASNTLLSCRLSDVCGFLFFIKCSIFLLTNSPNNWISCTNNEKKTPKNQIYTVACPAGNGARFILNVEIGYWFSKVDDDVLKLCSFFVVSIHSVALPKSNCSEQTFGTAIYMANAHSLSAGRLNTVREQKGWIHTKKSRAVDK